MPGGGVGSAIPFNPGPRQTPSCAKSTVRPNNCGRGARLAPSSAFDLGRVRPHPRDTVVGQVIMTQDRTPSTAAEHDLSATDVEAQLRERGDFAAYHLSKAKRLYAAGNMKEAIYQAGACLAHDPRNAEARTLRKQARAAR